MPQHIEQGPDSHLKWSKEKVVSVGREHEQLARLNLPHKLIFIDVNGTLIAEDAVDGDIPAPDVEQLKNHLAQLTTQGWAIGLCSDSPLPQLIEYGEKLDITGPMIAENGQVLCHQSEKLVLKPLPNLNEIKELLVAELNKSAYAHCQTDDCIAQEFGGVAFKPDSPQWAFGANREASITIFGPIELITMATGVVSQVPGLTADVDPTFPTCIMIHQGNYRAAKSETLSLLAAHGHQVVMIGNSNSDWVDPTSGVLSTFVANQKLSDNLAAQLDQRVIAAQPLVKGVIEILSKISAASTNE